MAATEISLDRSFAKTSGVKKTDRKIFAAIGYSSLTILALLCLLPFLLVVSSSLTNETTIVREGYQFIPLDISLEAYGILFKYPGRWYRRTW